MGSAQETGAAGERAAADYLRGEGFAIVATNWRSGRYELDIVAERGDCVHFVEVKCRRAGAMTSPEEAIDMKKVRSLFRAANDYISANGVDKECRMDLIAVDAFPDGTFNIRYMPDAIQSDW